MQIILASIPSFLDFPNFQWFSMGIYKKFRLPYPCRPEKKGIIRRKSSLYPLGGYEQRKNFYIPNQRVWAKKIFLYTRRANKTEEKTLYTQSEDMDDGKTLYFQMKCFTKTVPIKNSGTDYVGRGLAPAANPHEWWIFWVILSWLSLQKLTLWCPNGAYISHGHIKTNKKL